MDNKLLKEIVDELKSLKKLMILQLLRAEISQKHIASMLEVSEATMSRMIPKGANANKRARSNSKIKESEVGAGNDE